MMGAASALVRVGAAFFFRPAARSEIAPSSAAPSSRASSSRVLERFGARASTIARVASLGSDADRFARGMSIASRASPCGGGVTRRRAGRDAPLIARLDGQGTRASRSRASRRRDNARRARRGVAR
jgi:hypothetical protein